MQKLIHNGEDSKIKLKNFQRNLNRKEMSFRKFTPKRTTGKWARQNRGAEYNRNWNRSPAQEAGTSHEMHFKDVDRILEEAQRTSLNGQNPRPETPHTRRNVVNEGIREAKFQEKKEDLEAIMDLEEMMETNIPKWKFMRKLAVIRLKNIMENTYSQETAAQARNLIMKIKKGERRWSDDLRNMTKDFINKNLKKEFTNL